MKSPSEKLVEVIAPLLVEQGLLLQEDMAKYQTKFAAGTMKEEDWILAAEKAAEKAANKGAAG